MVSTSLGNWLTIFLNLIFLSQPLFVYLFLFCLEMSGEKGILWQCWWEHILEMSGRALSIHFFAMERHYEGIIHP